MEVSVLPVLNSVVISNNQPVVIIGAGSAGSLGGGAVGGTGTANQIAYWTSLTTIGALSTSTYPTLTELSYVKGVTSAIQTQINSKQATLVSGTNIKTINGTSLLGSGDYVPYTFGNGLTNTAGAVTLGGALTSPTYTQVGTTYGLLFDTTGTVYDSDFVGIFNGGFTGTDFSFSGVGNNYAILSTRNVSETASIVVDSDPVGMIQFWNSSERFRISNTGAFGIGGANYGSAGQVFTSNGSGAAPSWNSISSTLAALTDVTLTSLASNDFLKYNGSAWINRTPANVRTDLGLDTWTNLTSTVTGTAPYWSLANGGTLTGTNTLALDFPLIFNSNVTSGTGATAGMRITGNSLTTGNLLDVSTTTLTSGRALAVASTSTAIDHTAGTNALFSSRISGANANSTRTAIAGEFVASNTGTSSTNYGLYASASGATTNYGILVGAGQVRFPNWNFNGATLSGVAANLTITNASNDITLSTTSSGNIAISPIRQLTLSSGSNGFSIIYSGAPQTSSTNITSHSFTTSYNSLGIGTNSAVRFSGSFTNSSTAGMNMIGLDLVNTYNYTSTGSGTITGIRYAPTRTGLSGVTEYAIITSGGQHGFGTLTPTANTTVDVVGIGTTTANILRLANSANTERFTVKDDGTTAITGAASISSSLTLGGSGAFNVNKLGTGALNFQMGGSTRYSISDIGSGSMSMTVQGSSTGSGLVITQPSHTGGVHSILTLTGGSYTGITASTENTNVNFDFSNTKTWLTGALTTQREFKVQSPTYAFAGSSTITTASNLSVGVPIAGSNATLTTSIGINAEATAVGAGTTNGYGGFFNATTGATNNFALGISGAVGLGGSAGTSGQVLTSAGAGATPTWTTPSGVSSGTNQLQKSNGSGGFTSAGITTTVDGQFDLSSTNFAVTTTYTSMSLRSQANGGLLVTSGVTSTGGSTTNALEAHYGVTGNDNATYYPFRLTRSGDTPTTGAGVGMQFYMRTGPSNLEIGSTIESVGTDLTSTSEDFDLVFKTMTAGAAATEKFRIESTGDIFIGTTATSGNRNIRPQSSSSSDNLRLWSPSGETVFNVGTGGIEVSVQKTGTNDISTGFVIERESTGTASAGIGNGLYFSVQTGTTGLTEYTGAIQSVVRDVTGGTERADLRVQTQLNGETFPIDRQVYRAMVDLTESTATTFASITIGSGEYAGGEVLLTVSASDGTDHQVRTQRFLYTVVNKAGTLTATLSTPEEVVTASTGTLTSTITTTDAGSGKLEFKSNSVSSLSQTSLRAQCIIQKNLYGSITN